MKKTTHLRNLGKAFKFFVLGSFVATRTASGAADPEESLRHELAWATVRDGLTDVVSDKRLSDEIYRMVQHDIEQNLGFRVDYTYSAILPDEVAQLDALWMDRLADLHTGAEEMDQFLAARSTALRQLVQTRSDSIDSPEELRDVIREFSRSDYTG